MPVLLAAAFTVIIGITGLAIDFGFATLERRQLQNAADGAAISGAINLVNDQSPTADVQTMANRNATTSALTCDYVNDSNATTAACSTTTVPGASSGVRVVATNTRPTFFMQVLGIPTVTVSADAIARISAWQTYSPNGALFIPCGYDTVLAAGGTRSILNPVPSAGQPWTVNPAAIGARFAIHDPQANHADELATCGMHSSRFKGLLDTDSSFNATAKVAAPVACCSTVVEVEGKNGHNTGPTRRAVNAMDGCQSGLTDNYDFGADNAVNNCVMILPIAISARSSGSNDYFRIVRWLPFRISDHGSNGHAGTLLGTDYVLREETDTTYTSWRSDRPSGPTSVRTVR